MNLKPKKALGQHFLADANLLGVIGRLAELAPDDVVLEIGPGLGALTRYLAARVALVHAVEIDRSLEPHLHVAENVAVRPSIMWLEKLARCLPLAASTRCIPVKLPITRVLPSMIQSPSVLYLCSA